MALSWIAIDLYLDWVAVWVLVAWFVSLLGARVLAAGEPRVVINEVAWGGTAASPNDEWIELYNAGTTPVDLTGWQLRAADGTPTIDLTGVLAPGAFLLLERSDDNTIRDIAADIIYTGALSNRGEQLLLVNADGQVVDRANGDGGAWPAGSAGPAYRSMERIDPTAPDRDDNWASNDGVHRWGLDAEGQPINGTPGGPNSAAGASGRTPTPSSSPSPTATASPSPTATDTATPVSTPSPTATAVPPGRVLIQEVLYDAPQSGPDAAYEWVELYNPGPEAISLAGWRLADNTAEDVLPDVLLPPGGLLVVAADADAFRTNVPDFRGRLVVVADGRIGGGLANNGDRLALLDPTGAVVDALSYGNDATWLDPPAPDVPAGHSLEREPPGLDTDAATDWADRFPPSPGQLAPPATSTPTPSPTPTPSATPTVTFTATPVGTPSPTPTATPTMPVSGGSIQGYVFLDRNGDGHRQPDSEPGIGGVWIYLDTGLGAHTFPSGWYGFYDLPAGTYTVIESQPEGYESTTPDRRTVQLAAGELRVGVDFGERPPIPTATPFPPGALLIHEVQPDPIQAGADAPWEWIELYNPGDQPISLAGWTIADNAASDPLPSVEVPAQSFLVLAADADRFRENFPDFAGALAALADGTIGGGLGNGGDRLVLYDPSGVPVDGMSYGSDVSELAPAPPAPAPGHSLERMPAGRDTDRADDWVERAHPSPGGPGAPEPTPTATPTPSPSPTPPPTVTPPPGGWPMVALNELLPYPAEVDWDGDGEVTAEDEWIELYNPGDIPADLTGWVLDDAPEGGSAPYMIPAGTSVPARGFLLLFRSVTGLALNNDADQVRLSAPDGALIDAFAYQQPEPDVSFSRSVDGVGPWVTSYPPSPGQPNRPPPPTPTPTSTPTPTVTPTPMPDVVRLNELLPAPRQVDWDGDGAATAEDEWIELYNLGTMPVDLGGWVLDDAPEGGSAPYVIPAGTWLAPGGLVVFFRSQTGLALNNNADEVRLLAPDGSLRDRFAYEHARPDAAFARVIDGVGEWTDAYPPSPGRPNRPPTPTPTATPAPHTVFLNEVLPAPRDRDWDGDGMARFDDEWVELVNVGASAVDLGGWMLDDVLGGGSRPYVFPEGTVIPPGSYWVVFRRVSGVALNNGGDAVYLLFPDGREADRFVWDQSPGYDRSFGRQPDGYGRWQTGLSPSPGEPNPPLPTPQASQPGRPSESAGHPSQTGAPAVTPSPAYPTAQPKTEERPALLSIAQARRQPDETLVRVRGQVTAPPGVFGRSIYIQDPSSGIQVYLTRGQWPSLQLGDWVEVWGRVQNFHGEREIKITHADAIRVEGPGVPPQPIVLHCDQVNERYEGMLVMVVGQVTQFGSRDLWLSDGRGKVRVYVRQSVGWRRPRVKYGEWWSVVGVVSRYVRGTLPESGYRVLPRFLDDLAPMPVYLPAMGATIDDTE